jgi:hypothetical protein
MLRVEDVLRPGEDEPSADDTCIYANEEDEEEEYYISD